MSRLHAFLLRRIAYWLVRPSQWEQFFRIAICEARSTYYEDNDATLEDFMHEQLARAFVPAGVSSPPAKTTPQNNPMEGAP